MRVTQDHEAWQAPSRHEKKIAHAAEEEKEMKCFARAFSRTRYLVRKIKMEGKIKEASREKKMKSRVFLPPFSFFRSLNYLTDFPHNISLQMTEGKRVFCCCCSVLDIIIIPPALRAIREI